MDDIIELVKRLLKMGADVNVCTSEGQPLLCYATHRVQHHAHGS